MVDAGDAQREAIIDATVELLLREGAAGLNVTAIMAEAGVSRTAFYRRFDTAHDLTPTPSTTHVACEEPRDTSKPEPGPDTNQQRPVNRY